MSESKFKPIKPEDGLEAYEEYADEVIQRLKVMMDEVEEPHTSLNNREFMRGFFKGKNHSDSQWTPVADDYSKIVGKHRRMNNYLSIINLILYALAFVALVAFSLKIEWLLEQSILSMLGIYMLDMWLTLFDRVKNFFNKKRKGIQDTTSNKLGAS